VGLSNASDRQSVNIWRSCVQDYSGLFLDSQCTTTTTTTTTTTIRYAAIAGRIGLKQNSNTIVNINNIRQRSPYVNDRLTKNLERTLEVV